MSCVKRTVRAAACLALLAAFPWAGPALAGPGKRKCSATITGSFADSCRDFAAHSSKDISFVELHYASGSVVKDETVDSRDWSIDGGPGDEIDSARVKSGTTIEEFECEASNAAPTAVLEIQTPPVDQVIGHCFDFFTGTGGGLLCEQSSPRTAWLSASQVPDNGFGETLLIWGCGGFTFPCPMTFSFRGTGSSDPDGDLASWSLDFGDGTSVSGTWGTAPPAEVAHEYLRNASGEMNCTGFGPYTSNACAVTLTVTDSAGQSDSVVLMMVFLDQRPD